MTPEASPLTVEGIVFVRAEDTEESTLRVMLSERPELRLLDEVSSTRDAVTAIGRHRPRMLLMDVGADPAAGLATIPFVRQAAPDMAIMLHARLAGTVEAPGMDRWLDDLVRVLRRSALGPGLAARIVLPSQPRSVPLARSLTCDLLAEWELVQLVDPISLVVSELVANAVLHAHETCALELTCGRDLVRVAVADADSEAPRIKALSPASERGRGLHLVSAFSSRWGVDPLTDGGKLVWAELDRVTGGSS